MLPQRKSIVTSYRRHRWGAWRWLRYSEAICDAAGDLGLHVTSWRPRLSSDSQQAIPSCFRKWYDERPGRLVAPKPLESVNIRQRKGLVCRLPTAKHVDGLEIKIGK